MTVCRDIVKVVYPLLIKSTGLATGLYTGTNYDLYVHNKVKMVRGEPEFYAENLTNKSSVYKHISKMPKVIEDDDDFETKWKYKYNDNTIRETNTIENYVTHLWLSK